MDTLDKYFKEKLENNTSIEPYSWSEQKGWQAYRAKYGRWHKFRNYKATFYAAASVIILVAMFFGYMQLNHQNHSTMQFSEIQLANKQYFAFKDGAKYKYKISTHGQIDTLMAEGECYIESEKSPVVILLKNSTLIGHNATFAVKALAGEQNIQVTVLKGRVSVWHSKIPGIKLDVLPNEQCTYFKEGYFIAKETLRDNNFLAWYTGRLVFEGAPMSVVAQKLSEHYNVRIGFTDSAMMYCRISSVIDKQNFEHVMRSMAKDYHFEIDKRNNQIMLSGGLCK